MSLRVAAAQLDTVVGDLSGNVDRILAALAAAEAAGADLCVLPELAITGYPPEDLLLKPGFVADNLAALEKVAAASGQCAVVVGFVDVVGLASGRAAASRRARRPRPSGQRRRHLRRGPGRRDLPQALLPNYGVFDEQRWFVPGTDALRSSGSPGPGGHLHLRGRLVRPTGRWPSIGPGGADVVVNLNASPYSRGRRAERLAMLRRAGRRGRVRDRLRQPGRRARTSSSSTAASLVLDADGTLLAAGAAVR